MKDYPKCLFHVDCTQALGKIDIDFSMMDLASISAHKIYGMKGSGLLIKNKDLNILPLIHGGKSTTIYRSGTPALPLIVSTMKAIELVYADMDKNYSYVEDLKNMKRHRQVSWFPISTAAAESAFWLMLKPAL